MVYLCIIPFTLGLVCYGYAFWIISKRAKINKSGNIGAAGTPKSFFIVPPMTLFIYSVFIILIYYITEPDKSINLAFILTCVVSVVELLLFSVSFRFGITFENAFVIVYPLFGKRVEINIEEVRMKQSIKKINYKRIKCIKIIYANNKHISISSICQGYSQIERLYNEKFANKTDLTDPKL